MSKNTVTLGRKPRNQSHALLVGKVPPSADDIKARKKAPNGTKCPITGFIVLYINDFPTIKKRYNCRKNRSEIIARWMEEYYGDTYYIITPNPQTKTR